MLEGGARGPEGLLLAKTFSIVFTVRLASTKNEYVIPSWIPPWIPPWMSSQIPLWIPSMIPSPIPYLIPSPDSFLDNSLDISPDTFSRFLP
jgi:hypothetical protein